MRGNSKPYAASLEFRSDLPCAPHPPKGKTGAMKWQILCLKVLKVGQIFGVSHLLFILKLSNEFEVNRKPYAGSLENWSDLSSDPNYRSNWGYKINILCFCIILPSLLLLELSNLLGGDRKPYTGSLESHSDLLPVSPDPLIGQTGIIKFQVLWFGLMYL